MIEESTEKENVNIDAKKLASEQTALVPYLPKSKAPFKLNTLIPRNMAYEVQRALNKVVQRQGNLDNYVRDHLKYNTVEELWKGLAAEQVDSIALYLHQLGREQGLIIGDQTGVGKGRQAAGMIRHAILNGYLPVFFTRKPNLFTDLYRDLKNIGFDNIHPYIINTDSDGRIKDAEGHVVFTPSNSQEQYEELVVERKIATDSLEARAYFKALNKKLPDPEITPFITLSESVDYLPEGYDMILCTYSQIQAAHHYKRQWIRKLLEKGMEGSKKFKKVVFILDESHMAGGYDSIIGKWMRSVLKQTKCTGYLSATFAKYPEVMPLYAPKTAIQESTLSDFQLVYSMKRGGLALQEIVASNLAESGQLIVRQRSNEGINVFYHQLDQEPARSKNRDRVDQIVQVMNEIAVFQQKYITPYLEEMHQMAKTEGERIDTPPKSLGVNQSPYFSRVFNIIDQMLFALKVEEVARQAIKLLEQDKKVVIAFKSTMGAFLKDLNLVSGDVLNSHQLDFMRTLQKGLDSIFQYGYTDIDNVKTRELVPLEFLGKNAIQKYEEIKKSIWAQSSGMTISPIDELIQLIEKKKKPKSIGGHDGEHFRVAEVTGRNQRVVFQDDEAVVQTFKTDTEKFFRLFNSGEYDVLLINQTGSTGSSAHASVDFKDQRQRSMIIHQFELDINTEIQKRGRINRTGQVVKPEYHYITTDIPMEIRLMTMLKGKLKSLDANTTASQNTNKDALKSADFMNKYGDLVAFQWASENQHMMEKMGWPTYHKTWGGDRVRNPNYEGSIRQITGRAGLLSVDEQENLYNDLLQRYEYQVNWEKQQGTYDLETEFLQLDADIQGRFLNKEGKGGSTPFGKDAVRDETIINNYFRPMTKDELDQVILNTLEDRTPHQHRALFIKEVEDYYNDIIPKRRAKREQTLSDLKAELDELPQKDSHSEAEENEKIDYQRGQLESLIRLKTSQLDSYISELEKAKKVILEYAQIWAIGEVIKFDLWGKKDEAYGVFVGVEKGFGDNPYALSQITLKFVIAHSMRAVKYSLAHDQRIHINMIRTKSKELKPAEMQAALTDWNETIKNASQNREKRHILTENIVAVSDQIDTHNRLIKYNTKDGKIKTGILLKRTKDGEIPPTLAPISKMANRIEKMENDKLISDYRNRVRFKRNGVDLFQIRITKKANKTLFLDATLRSLIQKEEGQNPDVPAEFVQNAGDMTALLHLNQLEAFLKRLDDLGLQVITATRKLEDWEIENAEDWNNKNTVEAEHIYKLTQSYGQGSQPSTDFIRYEEPSTDFPFGRVIYGRPLTDKERFHFSLIPYYPEAEIPYQQWKTFLNQQPELKKEFLNTVQGLKEGDIPLAILTLGFFILNHPHEDGNPEFIFGEYDEVQLGRVAYEDTVGELTPLDLLHAQLKIELEHV